MNEVQEKTGPFYILLSRCGVLMCKDFDTYKKWYELIHGNCTDQEVEELYNRTTNKIIFLDVRP